MLMTNLVKLGQVPWRDRMLIFQSVLLLPVLDWGLTLLGYARVRGGLEKISPLQTSHMHCLEPEMLQRAREIARIVAIGAEHGLYKATCLRRSVLVWWFLRQEGIQSRICFGVRLNNQQLEAHAWVEVQDTVINDSSEIRSIFRVLEESFPPTAQGL